jgi:hypothetical protein
MSPDRLSTDRITAMLRERRMATRTDCTLRISKHPVTDDRLSPDYDAVCVRDRLATHGFQVSPPTLDPNPGLLYAMQVVGKTAAEVADTLRSEYAEEQMEIRIESPNPPR